MDLKINSKDAVILGMLSKYPGSGRAYVGELDPKLQPVGKFFVTLKADADIAKKHGPLIHALAKWGRVVTVKDDKQGGLIGELRGGKTVAVAERMFAAH